MEEQQKKMRIDCWNLALDALGYSYIYSKRIAGIEVWLRWSKILGLIIPVALGGLVSGYYTNHEVMDWAIALTTPIALAQLVVSAYLTAAGADEKLTAYMRRAAEYSMLNGEFELLAKYPAENHEVNHTRFLVLNERLMCIGKDNQILTDAELRRGMRYGLRNYNRACVSCKEVPYSMQATKCDVCGNF